MQEIMQEKRSQNKREQRRERVRDYMLPPSQPSVSMSSICLGMSATMSKMMINCSDLQQHALGEASGELLGLTDGDFGDDFAGALLWHGARRGKRGLAGACAWRIQSH